MHSQTSLLSVGDQELLCVDSLLFAIAKHHFPDPPLISGLPGVIGKHEFHPPRDGGDSCVGFHSATGQLTASDTKKLRDLLDRHADTLPVLRVDMSAADIDPFLQAYRAIADRPMSWEPRIFSTEEREKFAWRRLDLYTKHAKHLQKDVQHKKIRLFDADRIPLDALQMPIHSFLTRDDAKLYLESLGLCLPGLFGEALPEVAEGGCEDAVSGEGRSEPLIEGATAAVSPALGSTRESPSSSEPDHLEPAQAAIEAPQGELSDLYQKLLRKARARKHRQPWPEDIRDYVIYLCKHGRDDEAARLIGYDTKTAKQYAREWQRKKSTASGRSRLNNLFGLTSRGVAPGNPSA